MPISIAQSLLLVERIPRLYFDTSNILLFEKYSTVRWEFNKIANKFVSDWLNEVSTSKAVDYTFNKSVPEPIRNPKKNYDFLVRFLISVLVDGEAVPYTKIYHMGKYMIPIVMMIGAGSEENMGITDTDFELTPIVKVYFPMAKIADICNEVTKSTDGYRILDDFLVVVNYRHP